jgi:hypothetical protein
LRRGGSSSRMISLAGPSVRGVKRLRGNPGWEAVVRRAARAADRTRFSAYAPK